MRDERFEVTVTFDERRGYIVTAPELRQPVLALSLGGLRNLRTPSAMARQILFCASSFESASQRHDAFGGVRQRATEDAVIPSAPHPPPDRSARRPPSPRAGAGAKSIRYSRSAAPAP